MQTVGCPKINMVDPLVYSDATLHRVHRDDLCWQLPREDLPTAAIVLLGSFAHHGKISHLGRWVDHITRFDPVAGLEGHLFLSLWMAEGSDVVEDKHSVNINSALRLGNLLANVGCCMRPKLLRHETRRPKLVMWPRRPEQFTRKAISVRKSVGVDCDVALCAHGHEALDLIELPTR